MKLIKPKNSTLLMALKHYLINKLGVLAYQTYDQFFSKKKKGFIVRLMVDKIRYVERKAHLAISRWVIRVLRYLIKRQASFVAYK